MQDSEKLLILLCASASKGGDKKLSYRIAVHLASLGFANIGTLQDLSRQHATPGEYQQKMVFINNCGAGCLRVLTHGFNPEKFIYFDVSPFSGVSGFDIDHYINTEILVKLNDKWILHKSTKEAV